MLAIASANTEARRYLVNSCSARFDDDPKEDSLEFMLQRAIMEEGMIRYRDMLISLASK